jgi:hypothetical protein
VLLHVIVVLLVVAAVRLMPGLEPAELPQERTVEVVVVPAPAAPPASPPVARDELSLAPPNLSETARFGPESVLPPAPELSQADRPEPTADAPATTPLPAPRLERSTPAEAPEPALPRQQAEPAPPEPPVQAAEEAPATPAPAPPPPPTPQRQMVIVVPPMQLEQPPAPNPAPRPQPRPPFQPRLQPEPRPAPQGRGELRELDLFGPGRQAPRQTASARAGAPGPLVQEATRTEGDFILRQILRHWRLNYRDPRYRDMAFVPGSVVLLSDGTLAAPYGRTDPWDPFAMIVNYGELTTRGREEERFVVDTFLTALRDAQPFQLPPTQGTYPRRVRITFRLGDL